VRETSGSVGYGGFECSRIGVILCGYSNRVAPAPVVINGRRQRILETGMNTSFVSVDSGDKVGDEVVLLGDKLDEEELASALHVRPHEILCRYTSMGARRYTP
jgi:alanine racemase